MLPTIRLTQGLKIWYNFLMIYKKKASIQKLNQELTVIIKRIEGLTLPKGFLEFAIYAVSEIFTNVLEHSKAKGVVTEISINKKNFLAKVTDNGIGLNNQFL